MRFLKSRSACVLKGHTLRILSIESGVMYGNQDAFSCGFLSSHGLFLPLSSGQILGKDWTLLSVMLLQSSHQSARPERAFRG